MRARRQHYILLLGVCWCLLVPVVVAQTDRALITVFVNDGSGNGLASAHVTIIPLGTPMPWPMKFETGESGEVSVHLQPGEYVVIAKAQNCGTMTTHVIVHDSTSQRVPLALQRSAAYCTVLASPPVFGPIQMGPCENWVQD